jgi:hypothetical protein
LLFSFYKLSPASAGGPRHKKNFGFSRISDYLGEDGEPLRWAKAQAPAGKLKPPAEAGAIYKSFDRILN